MKLLPHDCFESSKDHIASAMAGVEQRIGIGFRQPLCKHGEFILCLMVIYIDKAPQF